ncbi:hypothetical protein I4F81_001358 [Pyropia yezoensis]|uniref:Uncharacterized protein n=1 Tax=Pyropia yezoensis TaxID=2788 RepID=A0ACC3BLQ6_PYRYE|nr:hypothetical protein I4F81_001358 [Neopyropia yezoensis]
MRAPRLRCLVVSGALLVVLVAAIPAALSRRLRPSAVTGTYEIYGGQDDTSGVCPKKLTLGTPTQRSGVNPIWMVDYMAESISRDNTACEGGKLEVMRTMAFVDERFRARLNLDEAFLLFNKTNDDRHSLAWSDSVAIGMESLTCGDLLKWGNATIMLFGNDGWGVDGGGEADDLEIEDGRPHIMIVDASRLVWEGVTPSTSDAAPPPVS